jgi:hypothetical protein
MHVIATDGCFRENDIFRVCPTSHITDLVDLFRYEVFKMHRKENLITDAVIEKILQHLGLWETKSHDAPKSGDQLLATHDKRNHLRWSIFTTAAYLQTRRLSAFLISLFSIYNP